jgi:colanic acid/amylovoran biosynthesis glycosyltransferase
MSTTQDIASLRLCITCPNEFRYSETFIHNQIECLQPQVLLREGWHPSVLPNGSSFLPFPLSWLPVRGSMRRLMPSRYHRLYTFFLARLLRRHHVQVLLANYGPMGVALVDACQKAGVKLAVHFHGFDAYHYETLRQFEADYAKLFCHADSLIVVSTDMQQQVISLGARPAQVFLNPYGVQLAQFAGATPALQAPVFIFVGRFTAKKSPQNLIKAFALLLPRCPEARLVAIGDGELWEETKQLAQQLGINEAVEFAGVLPPSQVAARLRTARAFVQHSLRPPNGDSEGTPNTVLEASAAGLPIISTRHAGIKDAVLHGKTGFLVEEGDVAGMAQYMYQLATDALLAGQMGAEARLYMESHYAMPLRIKALQSHLASLLA